jgi:hypothetical protein
LVEQLPSVLSRWFASSLFLFSFCVVVQAAGLQQMRSQTGLVAESGFFLFTE